MMLGWTQASWIKLYNFQLAPGTAVDENITLSAIENGPPPPGQFAGIDQQEFPSMLIEIYTNLVAILFKM